MAFTSRELDFIARYYALENNLGSVAVIEDETEPGTVLYATEKTFDADQPHWKPTVFASRESNSGTISRAGRQGALNVQVQR
jgi:hypothetical protein